MATSSKRKVVALWETESKASPANSQQPIKTTLAGGPREFPVSNRLPVVPLMIPDEILDYYGWIYHQRGFKNLNMTFEQFLAVAATLSSLGGSIDED